MNIRVFKWRKGTDSSSVDNIVVFGFTGVISDQIFKHELFTVFDKAAIDVSAVKRFDFGFGKTLVLSLPRKNRVTNILLIGLGDAGNFKTDHLRRVSGIAYREIKERKIKNPSVLLISGIFKGIEDCKMGEAFTEGFMLSSFSYTIQTTSKTEDEVKNIDFYLTDGINLNEFKTGLSDALKVCRQVNMAREMISAPSNVMTPSAIAAQAKKVSKEFNLKCRVFSKSQAERMGMGAFLSVTRGSNEPPKLITLEYVPQTTKKTPLVALVGKGVTFDSGGISLKPAKDMHKMKYDMAGAAIVLGTIAAAASLKLPLRIVSIIPATENMPDGKASKPGDVVKSLSGKTIEIQNTDAEGRLILADALTLSLKYKPSVIIDVATLTGACVIALGTNAAGVMSNSRKITGLLADAGNMTFERVWELPLWDEYFDDIKSDIADIRNVGDGSAGAITGGIFLKQFVGDTPWAHLDIAGTTWIEKKHDYLGKGASGSGIRLLSKFLTLFAEG